MTDSQEDRPKFTAGEDHRQTANEETATPQNAHQQAHDELRRVEQVVSEITGLPSNWSGTVELHISPTWRGAKPFRCDILLDAGRQELDVRWRTHLHEMLHAHSAGYSRTAFDTSSGWEEGVVERLQRLLRPRVLRQLGLELPESVFAQEDAEHEYNPYVEALDSLYRLAKQPQESETDFYVALLATPINQRMAWMHARGKLLPPQEGSAFIRTLAAVSVTLRYKLRA